MSKKKKKRVGVKDITEEFLIAGVSGVARLFKENGAPKAFTFKEALRRLKKRNIDIDELNDWGLKNHGFGLTEPGRRSPTAGQKVTRTIQQGKIGPPFVKVPLSSFTAPRKGGQVEIDFMKDRVIVQPA